MPSPSGLNSILSDSIFVPVSEQDFRFSLFRFDTLVKYLREKPVVGTTKRTLYRIHLLTLRRHGTAGLEVINESINVRVFLAAYMIVHYPREVFESMGPLERLLFQAAVALLESFERILGALDQCDGAFASVPVTTTDQFPRLLYDYLSHFRAWKSPDQARLVTRIKHALIALRDATGHLPSDGRDDDPLKVALADQTTRLRDKLRQIAGPETLAEFDVELADMLAAPSPATPPTGFDLTTEQLAHELLLDPCFQLDPSDTGAGGASVMRRIRESFHRAFWNSLQDDLRTDPPSYKRMLRVIAELRGGLLEVATIEDARAVAETLDMSFITAQVDLGVMEWTAIKQLVGAVVGLALRAQSPARQAETTAMWASVGGSMLAADPPNTAAQPAALCAGLEFLLERINAMRIDSANTRLRLMSPVIKSHGALYERERFKEKLASGSLSLTRTSEWIEGAVHDSCMDMLPDLLEGNSAAFDGVHVAAMLSLVVDATPLPETLLLDAHRLFHLRNEYNYIVSGSSVLVIASQALAGRQGILDEFTKVIVGATEVDITSVLASLDHLLDDPVLRDTIRRGIDPTNPVRALM